MAVFLLLSAYFLIYADRKVWAAVQMRRGPNVVGAFGLLQSGADMLKLVFKEIIIPAGADKPVFFLAPLISFVMAILAWAVIPSLRASNETHLQDQELAITTPQKTTALLERT